MRNLWGAYGESMGYLGSRWPPPAGAGPAGAGPAGAGPAGAGPARAGPAGAGPAGASPAGAGPAGAGPAGAGPAPALSDGPPGFPLTVPPLAPAGLRWPALASAGPHLFGRRNLLLPGGTRCV